MAIFIDGGHLRILALKAQYGCVPEFIEVVAHIAVLSQMNRLSEYCITIARLIREIRYCVR